MIRISPIISSSKSNQKMKFGQLIEYNMRNIFLENHTQNVVDKLDPKNQNIVFLLYDQVEGYQSILKLSFTSYKAFFKKQKNTWNQSTRLVFCIIFEEKYSSRYILLTDQTSLSDWLYFFICCAIYCNSLFPRLRGHKFLNIFKLNLAFLSSFHPA